MIAEINGRYSVPADGGAVPVSRRYTYSREPGWPLRPYQIVSLLEMLKFWAAPYYQMMHHLDMYEFEVLGAIRRRSDSILEKFINENRNKETEGHATPYPVFVRTVWHGTDNESGLR